MLQRNGARCLAGSLAGTLILLALSAGAPAAAEPEDAGDRSRSEAEGHFEEAWQAYETGDFERARREFGQAVSHTSPGVVSTHKPDQPIPSLSDPQSPDYLPPYFISVGDTLGISVWQVDDLTRDAIVRPDGYISYPLVGDMPARGMTLSELTELISQRLQVYVREPQVTIELKERGHHAQITVLGEVNRQGVHNIGHRPISVLAAIGLAEGMKVLGAKIKDVVVIKGYPDHPQMIHVNVKDILTKDKNKQHVMLGDGDIIFVSRTWMGNLHSFMTAAAPLLNAITTYTIIDDALKSDE